MARASARCRTREPVPGTSLSGLVLQEGGKFRPDGFLLPEQGVAALVNADQAGAGDAAGGAPGCVVGDQRLRLEAAGRFARGGTIDEIARDLRVTPG